MIQQIFTGLSRLPDLTLRRADIESYSSVKPYTLRGPRLFTNTGASFVSSSFLVIGCFFFSIDVSENEMQRTKRNSCSWHNYHGEVLDKWVIDKEYCNIKRNR